jgi:predicted nucleic acid-binding protein
MVPLTEDSAAKWRLLVVVSRTSGDTVLQPELIVAATGLHHGLTVVSRDTTESLAARAPVFNPWPDMVGDAGGSQASH